jgi:hypothetical protein
MFTNVPDPVGAGFVDSLARPGGNAIRRQPTRSSGLAAMIYYANTTADVVTEAADDGFDSVHAFVTFTLPQCRGALHDWFRVVLTGNSGTNTLVTPGTNTSRIGNRIASMSLSL